MQALSAALSFTTELIAVSEPTKKTFDRLRPTMRCLIQTGPDLNLSISDIDREGLLNTYGDRCDFNSLLTLRENDAVNYEVDLRKKGTEKVELRSVDPLWNEIA